MARAFTLAQRLQNIIYSPDFYFASKQSIGIISLSVISFLLGLPSYITLSLTAGAWCTSAVDSQCGNKRGRIIDITLSSLLGSWTSFLISLTSSMPILSGLLAVGFVFVYSMFSIFGQRSTQIAFGCLLIMMLSMREEYTPDMAPYIALYTLLGCALYGVYSIVSSYLLRKREDRLILASSMFATANYMFIRGQFYDIQIPLNDCYRALRPATSIMLEKQHTARYILSRANISRSNENIILWNIYSETINLLNTMVASQTDYDALREHFQNHDVLLFMRDTLTKLSRTLEQIGLALSNNHDLTYRNSVKAELRAMEFEILQQKQQDLNQTHPDLYLLLVRILRRLRNAARIVDKMAEHLRNQHLPQELIEDGYAERSEAKKFSSSPIRIKEFFAHLNLHSSFMRFALRLTFAFAVVWGLTSMAELYFGQTSIFKTFSNHIYWINITLILIMRPGFSLTRQRIHWRLAGTLIGCIFVLGLFLISDNNYLYFLTLVICMIIGKALAGSNYRVASIFITIYVLLAFHFLLPESQFIFVGERALDTAIACAIAFACSFILPFWESNAIYDLAKKAIDAHHTYLAESLRQVHQPYSKDADSLCKDASTRAFHAQAAFADSYARMLTEPKSHQTDIATLNSLVIQCEALYNLIPVVLAELAQLSETPPKIQAYLDYVEDCINVHCRIMGERPTQLETGQGYDALIFPLKQMQHSATLIRQCIEDLGFINED